MVMIYPNEAPANSEVEDFLSKISFLLPTGFIDFYQKSNGADINSDDNYTILWPLTDLIQLNKDYDVDVYAPEFFIFGSDGGDTSFAIEKSSGGIFEMPFIEMSRSEAVFNSDNFNEFLKSR